MPPGNENRIHRLAWLHDIEIYEASFDDHVFGRHAHATFSIGAILEGVGGCRCRGVEHVLPVGALTLMNPEEVHTGRSVGGRLRYTMLYVGEAHLTEMIGIEGHRGFREVSPSERSRAIARAASRVARALRASDAGPGWRLQVEGQVHRLISAAFGQFGGIAPPPPRDEPKAVRHLCDRIAARVEDEQGDGLSVTEVAKELGLHPNYLIQTFSRSKGISPYAYYMSRKIDTAKNMIAQGHSPLEVALKLGFYDQAHFTRHFKKLLGVTPGNVLAH